MLKRIIFSVMIALGLVVSGFAIQTVAPATSAVAPQKAAACTYPGDYCERRFKSVDYDPIRMCKDWHPSGDHYLYSSTACPGANDIRWLSKPSYVYTRSDFGWTDTDGFHIPSGWNVAIWYYTKNGSPVWIKYKPTGWQKVGGCFSCLTRIKRYPQN